MFHLALLMFKIFLSQQFEIGSFHIKIQISGISQKIRRSGNIEVPLPHCRLAAGQLPPLLHRQALFLPLLFFLFHIIDHYTCSNSFFSSKLYFSTNIFVKTHSAITSLNQTSLVLSSSFLSHTMREDFAVLSPTNISRTLRTAE